MQVMHQQTEGLQKIAGLIEEVRTGMLTTPAMDGHMHSRPMQALQIDSSGSVWFITRTDALGKEADSQSLNLSFADPSAGTYVSLSGSSVLLRDQAKIDELWSPLMKAWFPEGKDDPSIAVLRVDIDSGEYWDASSSSMVRLVGLAASAIAGKEIALGDNDRVVNPAVSNE